jgi:hypothetical protein
MVISSSNEVKLAENKVNEWLKPAVVFTIVVHLECLPGASPQGQRDTNLKVK